MSDWIKGIPPRLSRGAVQIESASGERMIVMCPACNARGIELSVKYRPVSPEIRSAKIKGVSRNSDGWRLKSKCCDSDMVTMGDTTKYYLCLHCLQPSDAKGSR